MSVSIGILGGGFGLYGYLPAAVAVQDAHVVLLSRYRPHLCSRPELAAFADRVSWADSESALIEQADTLIIARRPVDQYRIIASLPPAAKLSRVVLEKPLAPSPHDAARVLATLASRNMCVQAGFTVAETAWAGKVSGVLRTSGAVTCSVRWAFRAHHYGLVRLGIASTAATCWKALHDFGGGALRFYGIHLLAMLARDAELEMRVDTSRLSVRPDGSVSAWECTLRTRYGAVIRLVVDSRASEQVLSVHTSRAPWSGETLLVHQPDPFTNAGTDASSSRVAANGSAHRELLGRAQTDRRVPLLSTLLDPSTPNAGAWLARTVQLWRAVEEASVFIAGDSDAASSPASALGVPAAMLMASSSR